MITGIRSARAEAGIAAGDIVDASMWFKAPSARGAYESLRDVFDRLARVRSTVVETRAALDAAGDSSLVVIGPSGEARLMRSEAHRERERARLQKELAQIESQLAAAESRLSDDAFVTRAPANVVEGARSRVNELQAQSDALRERIGEE
ncbi:MAG TPA: hypothetical protein VNN80_15125 [Polyangiaceae bacterium]|nr:hypothetical protein [Polyangiaceae bacterium]